ncbi:MAG TPA: patatin-like phospholipase family protein [Gemmatimonadales bacterium]|nr:patatin-like phospholipase family protein [Gemmatimonadales bacterium]
MFRFRRKAGRRTDGAPGTDNTAPMDPSLPLCEVLEQEYQAITGKKPDAPPDWDFTPEQILEPARFAYRLKDGHDRPATGLAAVELQGINAELATPLEADDRDALQRIIAKRLTALLRPSDLYRRDPDRFENVRFRSQTMDWLQADPANEENRRIRNRLVLEDTFTELDKLYDIRLRRVYRKIADEKLAALCLSGGGIRSATFALGVVQGLARHGLLDKFHYLSTVSGGGYLGAWLSAWIHHTSLQHVIGQLTQPSGRPLEPDPAPIWHLRTYSNYLSPRPGALSTDTWTLIATYLRNLFLNWLVWIPLLVGALALPLLLAALVRWAPAGYLLWGQVAAGVVLAVLGFVGGVQAVRYVHANRPQSEGEAEATRLDDPRRGQESFLRRCLAPIVCAALASTIVWGWASVHAGGWMAPAAFPAAFALLVALVHWVGWRLGLHDRSKTRGEPGEAPFIVATGAIAGLVAWIPASEVPALLAYADVGPKVYVTLALPFVLALLLVFSHIYVGYTSAPGGKQVDAAREWSARFSAWLLIVGVAWLAGFGLVLLGPDAATWALDKLPHDRAGLITAGKSLLAALGTVSGVVTLVLGHSAETPGTADRGSARRNVVLAVAAPVFLVFLLVLLGWLAGKTVHLLKEAGSGLASTEPGTLFSIFLTLVAATLLISFGAWTAKRVDTNKFSLHAMYRARLIRAYLGASRPAGERDPNRFTGFDKDDNLPLRKLWPADPSRRAPLHVINAALNLVGGRNLAWQQRKAESFTFTSLHCGASNQGYRPTRCASPPGGASPPGDDEPKGYGGRHGVSLGTAITISGAAVSPNMGYHSSPVISFLLALFNVRLGWWLGNPGYAGRHVYTRSMPESSLSPLLNEAAGRTDDRGAYVYLSDGGHFENLGLYEMVLRRCHFIVVSDGGCDPAGALGDLGNAIRKIRVDFGIPIEFKEIPIHSREGGGPARPGKYCAIGTIRYSCVDPDMENGTLLYLKPAFYGTEPADVQNYARTCKDFPHETTGDQFFTESQFESYRALGSHVVDQIIPLARLGEDHVQPSLPWLFRHARQYVSRPAEPKSKPGGAG